MTSPRRGPYLRTDVRVAHPEAVAHAEHLTIDVREAGIIVGGELDKVTAPELAAALEAFVGRTVQVDLAGVTFFDSSGIGALARAKASGIDVVIVEPSPVVHRVLDMVGLLRHFGLS